MISNIVLGISLVILLCVISEKFSYRIGVPALIFFMFIGMLAGGDGPLHIQYSDFSQAEMICSIGLIFIMFDGGFNTNWNHARPYVAKAVTLSSLGVLLTALITTVCCHFLIGLSYQESFLLSAVLASTDAASVFSILKSNNLDLKGGTSSILEVESGSNDPMAYLLTITAIGKRIKQLDLPLGSQAIMIKRDGHSLAARGKNVLQAGDDLIMNIPAYYPAEKETVSEVRVGKGHKWVNKTLEEIGFPDNELVIMIIRGEDKIIPNGDTRVLENDIMLVFKGE